MARQPGGQERHHVGDVLGARHVAQGNLVEHRVLAVVAHAPLHPLGAHEARRDDECDDVVGPETARDRARQRHHAGLRRGVVGIVRGVAAKGGAAGDVDDRAAATLAEVADGLAAQVRRRHQVDAEGARPRRGPGLEVGVDARRDVDAGVVDQHVDAALPGNGVAPQRGHAASVLEIGPHQVAPLAANLVGERHGALVAPAVVQHDVASRAREGADDGGADPSRPAGHEGHLSAEIDHGLRFLPLRRQRTPYTRPRPKRKNGLGRSRGGRLAR